METNMTTKNTKRNIAAESISLSLRHMKDVTPELYSPIYNELTAQRRSLKLIASENYSSYSVQITQGNFLTDKYAEGYPSHRFYAGCENIDTIENDAIKKAQELFGCDYACVQPHSGSDANLLAMWSVIISNIQPDFLEQMGVNKVEELNTDQFEQLRQKNAKHQIIGYVSEFWWSLNTRVCSQYQFKVYEGLSIRCFKGNWFH